MKLVAIVLSLAVMAPATAACGRAQAKTTPDGPPLDIPAPPPREIEPATVEVPAPVTPAPEAPRTAAPRPPPTRPAPVRENRPEPPKPEPPKPEPSKPEPGEPPKAASPVNEEAKPAATLQTKPAGEEGDVERGIRGTLTHANTDLNRVDYRKLNNDARSQYDYAKRFIAQAEDAIRAKNLVFAKTVADKAAALAAQLAGR